MKQFLSLLLAIGLSLSAIQGTSGQTPQGQDEVIRVRTNEVRLDVVVKDKKGRPVKDLTAGDFEVLEDGVSQKIASFRFVNRDAAPEADTATRSSERKENNASASVTTPPTANRTSPGITALVFDRL